MAASSLETHVVPNFEWNTMDTLAVKVSKFISSFP